MTPQEKARELMFKMYETGIDQYDAIQCALIAVDEILYLLNEIDTDEFELFFYEDVKQEIEKL